MTVLKVLLRKWNDLPVFDPSLWPRRELSAKVAGITACLVFSAHRVFKFKRYTGDIPPFLKPLFETAEQTTAYPGIDLTLTDWHWLMWFSVWIIETGILAGYIAAFLSRSKARSVAKGFMEVVFPFVIAVLPFLITAAPMNFKDIWPPLFQIPGSFVHQPPGPSWLPDLFRNWESLFFLFLGIIIAGGSINLIGLLTLRKAFTITAEARVFIRRGLFTIVRHPLYTGHFVMFCGYLLFHLHWYTVGLYVVFVAGQWVRARMEEKKLLAVFPEYADYLKTTWMFFPKICGKKKSSTVHGNE